MNKQMFVAALLSTALAAAGAQASGFNLREQSAAGVALSTAGAGVEASAAGQFTNPATLGLIGRPNQIQAGGSAYALHSEFQNAGTTQGPVPVGGPNASTDPVLAAPFGYYARDLGNGLHAGLGLYSMFGLTTDYDSNWVGRYQALKSRLTTFDIAPSVAYEVNDAFTVGAALVARYSDANLTSAINTGGLLTGVLGAGANQAFDTRAKVTGDDWGFGYKLGLTWKPQPATVLGLSYISQVHSTLKGDVGFDYARTGVPALDAGIRAALPAGGVTAEVTYPEQVSLSGSHKVNERLTLLGDVTWTNWSRFDELRVVRSGGTTLSLTRENWDDVWRVAVGATYDVTPALQLRLGASYDGDPIPDAEHVTARLPDGARYWLSAGIGYAVTDSLQLNLGYAHLFIDDARANHTDPLGAGGTLRGTFKDSSADILTADVVFSF
ncbi:MAG TPA: outer membrane protein transport protein [Alphaproteobacteria bacterium]|nr:outer membrane protein transport protein [Alphaproteobacteria bacterium]